MDKTNLYITEQGATIGCSHECLVVRQSGKKILEMPFRRLNQIVLFGNSTLSSQAVKVLLENRVGLAYLSSHGIFRGRLDPAISSHGLLRQKQTLAFHNKETRLKLSARIVSVKLQNSLAFCMRRKNLLQMHDLQKLKFYCERAARAKSFDELRGIEGSAARLYYYLFRRMLSNSMGFEHRIKNPPTDPVNVLLSLAYTLLYNRMHTAIELSGLDPYQGFFHEIQAGHAALASDLMEPFRPVVADSTVLTAVNRQMISRKDFRQTREGIKLLESGFEKFLYFYDKRMKTTIAYPGSGDHVDYYRCLEYQARELVCAIFSGDNTFAPFHVRA